jgi:hypothetical protein
LPLLVLGKGAIFSNQRSVYILLVLLADWGNFYQGTSGYRLFCLLCCTCCMLYNLCICVDQLGPYTPSICVLH